MRLVLGLLGSTVMLGACGVEGPSGSAVEQQSEPLKLGVQDGFESGGLTAGGWVAAGNVSVVGSAAQSGNYGARLGATGVMRTTLDTTGYRAIQVGLDWRGVGLDPGEYAVLEWAPATGPFAEVARITSNATWSSLDVELPEAAEDRSGVRLRFRVSANGLLEGVEVDNVLVTGTPLCTSDESCGPGLICDDGTCVPHCADGIRNGDELAVDCGGSCPECSGVETLLDEDFIDGLDAWVREPTNRVLGITGPNAYQNGPSAQLLATAAMTRTVATTGFEELTLEYVRRTSGLEWNEYFVAEVSIDGDVFTELERIRTLPAFAPVSFTLPNQFENQPALRIRFRAAGGYVLFLDYAVVDDVVLRGRVIATSCTTDSDCSAFDEPCAAGRCDEGVCMATPLPTGTSCGGVGEYCDSGFCVDCAAAVDSTFGAIQSRIFDGASSGCTASFCHGSTASGGLDLRTPGSYDALYEVLSSASSMLRVAPGNSNDSFLYRKLAWATNGTEVEGGAPMPSGGNPPLSNDELEGVGAWIQSGAPQSGFVPGTLALLCELPCATDADCDNGNPCDGTETCNVGTSRCAAGAALSCDDSVPCTADRCDPSVGCTNVVTAGLPCPGGVCDAAGQCGGCAPPDNTYDAIQTLVFDSPTYSCTMIGCHGVFPQLGLDLRPGASYDSLLEPGLNRVVPFNVEESRLYDKLQAAVNGTMPVSGGLPMPMGLPAITPELLAGIAAWIEAGAPQTGVVPGTEDTLCLPPTAPPGDLVMQWDFPTSQGITSRPLVTADTVYTTAWNGLVYALDRSTGEQLWSYDSGATLQGGVAAAVDGSLVFGNGEAVVRRLSASGSVLWTRDLDQNGADHIWQTVTVHEDLVYVPIASHSDQPCTKGRITALRLSDGVPVWTRTNVPAGVCRVDTAIECTTNAGCPGSSECVNALGGSVTGQIQVAADGESIYANTVGCYTFPSVGDSDSMMKLDADTGVPLWVARVSPREQFNYCPSNGADCRTSADCPGGGLCLPKGAFHDFGFVNGPLVIDAETGTGDTRLLVVSGSKDGTLYARDAATGAPVWENEVRPPPVSPNFAGFGLFNGALSYHDGKLFAALYGFSSMAPPAPDHLMAFSEVDGSIVWSDDIGPSWSSTGAANGIVYAGTQMAAELYSYNADTGARLGTFPLPNVTAGPPTIDDGELFIGYGLDDAGGLRAYRIE